MAVECGTALSIRRQDCARTNFLTVRTAPQPQENDPVLLKPTPLYLGIKYHLCNFLSDRRARNTHTRLGRQGGAVEVSV